MEQRELSLLWLIFSTTTTTSPHFSFTKNAKKKKKQSHHYFLWTPIDEMTFQLKLRVPVCYCWRLCLSSWSLPFFLASSLLSLFPSLPSPFLESRSLLLPSISFFSFSVFFLLSLKWALLVNRFEFWETNEGRSDSAFRKTLVTGAVRFPP